MVAKKGSIFVCNECGFSYKKKALAEECEGWCGEHHSCNMEIIRHAVKS